MPSIQDFSEDEDELRSKGGGASSGGGGAVLAQASPQRESEFTPWSRFVSANKDVAQTEAGKLTQRVTNDANAVKSATDKATGDFTKGIESNYSHFGDEAEGGFGGATPSSPRGEAVRTQAQQETTGGGIFGNEPTGFGASGAREVGKEAPTKHSARSPGPLPQDTEPYGAGAPIARPGGLEQITAGAQESTRTGLKPGALDAQPGPKDLEDMLGADAWSKLLGQAGRAQGEANALGSESGVQGLIQKSAAGPLAQGGAFDAALEYGEGRKDFDALNKQYGDGQIGKGLLGANESAQGAWHRLMGDIDGARGAEQPFTPEGPKGAEQYDEKALFDELERSREANWRAITAYSSGGRPGAVNALGNKDEYLDALKNGKQYGDKDKWVNTPSVQEQTDVACKALGITQDEFIAAVGRMTDGEFQNFWLLGVIPTWMDVGEGSQTYGKGVVGGWQAPLTKQIMAYGQDGGMWNAVTNMWKEGVVSVAKAAAGGPSGAVTGATNAATYKGPGGGK